jgi:Flp pilus assembly protein TadD
VRDHGLALLRLGRPAEAILPLRRYVLCAPGDAEAYRYLAEAFEQVGDIGGAAAQRRIAQALGPVA